MIYMFVKEVKDNVIMVYICIPLSNDGGAIKKLHHIVVDGKIIKRGDFY